MEGEKWVMREMILFALGKHTTRDEGEGEEGGDATGIYSRPCSRD